MKNTNRMKLNRLDQIFTEQKVYNRVLAKYLKKSESTISLWRNNRRQPSIKELHKIAELLRIDIRDLLEPTSWKTSESMTYKEYAESLNKRS